MSKYTNGGNRSKNARETYVEQLSNGRINMNKKRDIFTNLNPSDSTDLAYRSTPNYLRQLAQQQQQQQQTNLSPTELIAALNIPRTKSASELTPRNNLNRSMTGNPKYKAQEDYYDEIQTLKKDMKTVRDENSNLRAKIRRLEEDNARKRKEIDSLYDTNKDGDLRRTLSGSATDRNNHNNSAAANVVMSLKQRLFKLELQLKQKEITIDELKSDPKWTKSTELEIQNRALFGEVERQKVERLNYIQQNDYAASIDEEKKNAVRKLNREKDELKKENESLKKKVQEMEKLEQNLQLSARTLDSIHGKESARKTDDSKEIKRELDESRNKLDQANKDLKRTQRELDQTQEKLEQANVDLKKLKNERDEFRNKFEKVNDKVEQIQNTRDDYKQKLDEAKEELERERNKQIKSTPVGRSSPLSKRHEEPDEDLDNLLPSKSFKRPQSPTMEKRTPRASAIDIHQDLHSSKDNKNKESNRSFSPTLGSKHNNLGSDTNKSRPSSPSTVNESALKTLQASLRGHLSRNAMDKTPGQTSSREEIPLGVKKSGRILADDDDEVIATPTRHASSIADTARGSRQSLHNERNKFGSKTQITKDERDSSPKPRRSPSPTTDNNRASSPHVGAAGGSRQSLLNDKNKYGSKTQITKDERDSSPKPHRSSSPTADDKQSSSPHVGAAGGSKQSLLNERNKFGSKTQVTKDDRDSSPKPRRSPSPTADNNRASSPHVGAGGGSKQSLANERNKFGSKTQVTKDERDASPKPRRSPSPTADNNRASSSHVGRGGGSRQSLLNDKIKIGADSRFSALDTGSSSKLQGPSSPSNVRRSSGRISPENSNIPSKKSLASSKQSIKDIPEDKDDDDDVVV